MEAYDIKSNTWTNSLPEMNKARSAHSACVLGNGIVYVFCGGKHGRPRCFFDQYQFFQTNTIERIDAKALLEDGQDMSWEIINYNDN